MDKVVEQVFKVFNTLAREIQIYFLGGLVVGINVLVIDHFYYASTLLSFLKSNNLEIPVVFVIYLIGQFCMALYYSIFVWKKLEKKIDSVLGFDYNLNYEFLPKIFLKNQEVYFHFIERYLIQIYRQCTIIMACIINLLIDLFILIFRFYHWQVLLSAIVYLIGAICFYLVASKLESDNTKRVASLKELLGD
jgi:hypothetical protein